MDIFETLKFISKNIRSCSPGVHFTFKCADGTSITVTADGIDASVLLVAPAARTVSIPIGWILDAGGEYTLVSAPFYPALEQANKV